MFCQPAIPLLILGSRLLNVASFHSPVGAQYLHVHLGSSELSIDCISREQHTSIGSKVDEFPACLGPRAALCLRRTVEGCGTLALSTLVPHTEVLIQPVSSFLEENCLGLRTRRKICYPECCLLHAPMYQGCTPEGMPIQSPSSCRCG